MVIYSYNQVQIAGDISDYLFNTNDGIKHGTVAPLAVLAVDTSCKLYKHSLEDEEEKYCVVFVGKIQLIVEVSLLHFIVVLTLFEVKEALKTKFYQHIQKPTTSCNNN